MSLDVIAKFIDSIIMCNVQFIFSVRHFHSWINKNNTNSFVLQMFFVVVRMRVFFSVITSTLSFRCKSPKHLYLSLEPLHDDICGIMQNNVPKNGKVNKKAKSRSSNGKRCTAYGCPIEIFFCIRDFTAVFLFLSEGTVNEVLCIEILTTHCCFCWCLFLIRYHRIECTK